jgi:4-hydroxy-tetrahydrodipicolinate reductase
MTIKVAITGAGGRMGRLLIQEIEDSDDLELVAGFDLAGEGEPLSGGVVLSDASRLEEVLEETKTDVLIDFTIASSAVDIVKTAAEIGVNLVVGTTGFSETQSNEMRKAIEGNVAAVISPNFSVGVNIFWKLIEVASSALQSYDVEVIEAHHSGKKDAPSGTAVAAIDILKRTMEINEIVHGREGFAPRSREIGVHAVRAGDIVGDHTVLFAGPGERLEIKHQAHSRQAFTSGAVRAAIWVVGRPTGVYSMEDVLSSG